MSEVIVASCPIHRRRPDWSHDLCVTAIGVNRMNPGWGRRWARLPDGELVEWAVYTPVLSWSGPDVFLTEDDVLATL